MAAWVRGWRGGRRVPGAWGQTCVEASFSTRFLMEEVTETLARTISSTEVTARNSCSGGTTGQGLSLSLSPSPSPSPFPFHLQEGAVPEPPAGGEHGGALEAVQRAAERQAARGALGTVLGGRGEGHSVATHPGTTPGLGAPQKREHPDGRSTPAPLTSVTFFFLSAGAGTRQDPAAGASASSVSPGGSWGTKDWHGEGTATPPPTVPLQPAAVPGPAAAGWQRGCRTPAAPVPPPAPAAAGTAATSHC